MHPSIAHEDRELPVELSELRVQLNQATKPVSPSTPSHGNNPEKTNKKCTNTFSSLLGHASAWRPASLGRPYTSWTGAVQRYRLIKDLRAGSLFSISTEEADGIVGGGVKRSASRTEGISEQALSLGIWLIEKCDSHATSERFNEALHYASEVSRYFPQYSIGYLRLAQLLCVTNATLNDEQRQTRGGVAISSLMSDVAALLSCAVGLEPTNSHLAGCADMLLSLLCGMPTSADLWDAALYPRSLGDAVCLAFLAAPDADDHARLLVDGAASATSNLAGASATRANAQVEEEIAV